MPVTAHYVDGMLPDGNLTGYREAHRCHTVKPRLISDYSTPASDTHDQCGDGALRRQNLHRPLPVAPGDKTGVYSSSSGDHCLHGTFFDCLLGDACMFLHITAWVPIANYPRQIWQCFPAQAVWDVRLRPPPEGTGTAKCVSRGAFRKIGLFNGGMQPGPRFSLS